ncbi:hypothetical protein ACPPVS_15005 [Cellulomonas sp. McL0617]|uniref:hypothetical protein n=1 Tax=Cellulomonas sp. McL0617 TaxID=3415675 RepID=UPI003CEFE2E6
MTALPLPSESARSFIGRTWSAYAALGAGLVLLALASEHLAGHLTLGVALAALGMAELLWAVLALRGPAPAPRTALAVLLVGGGGWLGASVLVDGVLSGADLAAGALQLVAAVLLAVALRPVLVVTVVGSPEPVVETSPAGNGTRLAALTLGSLLFASITVPGLAATDAGDQAHMPGMPAMSSMHH